jgi:hypothetical protein
LALNTLEVHAARLRAMIAERQQHYAIASRAYTLVARAWSSGDPTLREMSAQSAKKAGQLAGGDTRATTLAQATR